MLQNLITTVFSHLIMKKKKNRLRNDENRGHYNCAVETLTSQWFSCIELKSRFIYMFLQK